MTTSIGHDPGQQEIRRATTFGMRLKQEREQRGITLDQISQSTKIGTRFLQALEADHFEQLPGGIFNKGFVRAYAGFVGLDEDQAVADFLAATGISEQTLEAPEVSSRAETLAGPETDHAAGLPWGVFATLLLIAAFSFAVWGFYSRVSRTRNREMSPPSPPPPAQTSAKSAESSPPPRAISQPINQPQPSSKSVPPTTSGRPSAQLVPAPSAPSGKALASPAFADTATPHDLVLRIKAREDAWISITVDGEVTTQQTLAASTEKTVRARRGIIIRAGNIGALDLEFKGQALPVQGNVGEVKTLAFDASGWHVVSKPAPAPAPEPQP